METGLEREKVLQALWQFLEERYPKLMGSGWLLRDQERRCIQDFLREFEETTEEVEETNTLTEEQQIAIQRLELYSKLSDACDKAAELAGKGE